MIHTKSKQLWDEAQQIFPGGVNSPVRSFKSVGGSPFFVHKGQGALLQDADGNEYVDYVLSWGPLILGHACPEVVQAVCEAAGRGFGFGAPTEVETLLAQKIRHHFPSMQMMRFVSSGTEAAMSAIRLARGYTGRNIIIKMDGCYHGHADSLLAKAGSGIATLALPDCPGVPEGITENTIVAPFNNAESIAEIFKAHPGEIAAVILEPVAGNMGVIPPAPGYLSALRSLTEKEGALLIFDEVMTGFRVAMEGCQGLFNVTPDLTILGKVIGGGLPVGAYGGRRDIMMHLAPPGPVYQAGTLSGNPVAMAAGLKTLEILGKPGLFGALTETMQKLCKELGALFARHGIPVYQTQAGTMACTFFSDQKVNDYKEAQKSDTALYARWFHAMMQEGVYWAPSQFEAAFISSAHDAVAIERTLDAAEKVLARGLPG
ncbi:MAG TPA: glutamate-1-semialdehyde 2,1-aminomutase [Candidatus Hydrogenedentes bacterium]|jgi:glutamate-1-semialdehyde 2,1-aminomutase|nr:glutamate-1-semialdehyde 2,1-aminomutase [Candidatus Hydrogenedentota bacterium]HOH41515.1 glutamate-1-semialdehyde 2,1-aminomutase [Candidatus Hydrogenedentota bacterium]HPX85880.1 glutamate-1-semialdehyde 2,1-aminomutase [Candidatus Hydrogenedentota bacterium]HQB02853.1 glutamate-1-semialdehyde 2,1-aminomutase [Candidatus Hydrogenedentota bacterium]